MPDLLVHGPRRTPVNAPPLHHVKPGRRRHTHGHGPFQVTRLIQGAGDLALSLRDGLTTSEREEKRWREERKQILAARMTHVGTITCFLPSPATDKPIAGRHAQ
jgi:TAG lipase/steryl ester hydrolase/phospholipase A2/LPA acyltransferase